LFFNMPFSGAFGGRVSASVISRICKEAGPGGAIRWDHIHGLLSSAVYGGRIDNAFDMRVLEAYIQQVLFLRLLRCLPSAHLRGYSFLARCL
jgi:hypothetical protein